MSQVHAKSRVLCPTTQQLRVTVLLSLQADADVIEGRKRLQTKWDEWCESRKEYADQLAQGKRKILGQYYSLDDDDYTIQEVETETQINYHEEVLKGDKTY